MWHLILCMCLLSHFNVMALNQYLDFNHSIRSMTFYVHVTRLRLSLFTLFPQGRNDYQINGLAQRNMIACVDHFPP